MYSFGLIASAVARGTSALRSAPRLFQLQGATTALALLLSGVGMAADLHPTHGVPAHGTQTSVSEPSMRVVGSLTGLGFATKFRDDLDAASAVLVSLKPREVAELWREIPRHFRSQLVTERADLIGNLAGVSYADRSAANESRLAELERHAEEDLHRATARNRSAAADAQSELVVAQAADRLEAVRLLVDRYGPGRSDTQRVPHFLIELDATAAGPPLAAVAVGDLDTALYASFFVPGMNSSVLQLPDYLRGVERMQEASDDSAAVLWLGYESPGPVDTVSTDHAEVGAVQLANALAGYDAVRDSAHSIAEVSLIGHSYGSTTAALALAQGNYGVSSFVMIGSAGLPSDLAIDDLHVRSDRVYVSQARNDALADSGRFWSGRADPAEPAWGAQFFGSDGTTLADGTVLAAVEAHDAVGASHQYDHNKYLGDGTESLYDIRKIITGQCHDVTPDSRLVSRDATILAEGGMTKP